MGTDRSEGASLWADRQALDAYEQHDRIVPSISALDAKTRIVDDWAAARALGADTIMLASRNADIADLNTLARVRRQELGVLSGPALRIEAGDRVREFQAGDEILLLRNDRRRQLRNGTRATIERVHERSNHAMTIIAGDGARHAIPAWYAEAGHVTHGYAMTIHKAQGLTCDQAFVYATDDLYQELGYVAM